MVYQYDSVITLKGPVESRNYNWIWYSEVEGNTSLEHIDELWGIKKPQTFFLAYGALSRAYTSSFQKILFFNS